MRTLDELIEAVLKLEYVDEVDLRVSHDINGLMQLGNYGDLRVIAKDCKQAASLLTTYLRDAGIAGPF